MHLANKTTISYIVKRIHKNYTPKNRQHNTIRTCHQYSIIFPLKLRKNIYYEEENTYHGSAPLC